MITDFAPTHDYLVRIKLNPNVFTNITSSFTKQFYLFACDIILFQ